MMCNMQLRQALRSQWGLAVWPGSGDQAPKLSRLFVQFGSQSETFYRRNALGSVLTVVFFPFFLLLQLVFSLVCFSSVFSAILQTIQRCSKYYRTKKETILTDITFASLTFTGSCYMQLLPNPLSGVHIYIVLTLKPKLASLRGPYC